jgi:hypothetical protein
MCLQLLVRSILSCLLLGDVPVGIEGSPLQFEDVEPLCERTLDFCKVGWKDSLHTCLIYVYNKVLPYLSCLARSVQVTSSRLAMEIFSPRWWHPRWSFASASNRGHRASLLSPRRLAVEDYVDCVNLNVRSLLPFLKAGGPYVLCNVVHCVQVCAQNPGIWGRKISNL